MTINNACWEDKMTCFAYSCGICLALHSTDELRKPCPFYKTKRQNKAECKKVIERLLADDRVDLILTYTCQGSKQAAKNLFIELGLFDEYIQKVEPMLGGIKAGTKAQQAAQKRYQKKKREAKRNEKKQDG